MTDFPIIAKLGGDSVVLDLLKVKGRKRRPPNGKGDATSAAAMRMWRQRGQLPSDVVTLLMAEADRQRVRYTSRDFLPSNPEQGRAA